MMLWEEREMVWLYPAIYRARKWGNQRAYRGGEEEREGKVRAWGKKSRKRECGVFSALAKEQTEIEDKI